MAYADVALSIGLGQTISQPYIVALMTEALGLGGGEKVLDLGTGSGYQAAVLAELLPAGSVLSVELIPQLAERARSLLRELGYDNVDVRQAGPELGCPEQAPFDAIIVAAAAPRLPEALGEQLAVGGHMVVPVGTLAEQTLVHVLRTEEGISIKMLGPCRFVPLIGPGAFAKT
jgi:protein-L-isoaspartate(D-aspartate) O-methyltransferase